MFYSIDHRMYLVHEATSNGEKDQKAVHGFSLKFLISMFGLSAPRWYSENLFCKLFSYADHISWKYFLPSIKG